MNEQDLLTFLIVFALFINCLGFLFFGLSLKGNTSVEYEERYREPKIRKPKKDKKEKLVPPPTEEEPYKFKTLSRDFEEEPKENELDDLPYQFNTMDGHDRFSDNKSHNESVPKDDSLSMFEDEDDGIPLKRIDDDPQQFSYEPVYEEEPKEHVENIHIDEVETSPYQFSYDEVYKKPTDSFENNVDEEPLKMVDEGLNRPIEPVDYRDEVETAQNTDDLMHRYDGEYQFKHAYTKAERYKYEYDDYKALKDEKPKLENLPAEPADEFDYDIDVDKEHEKFYGSNDDVGKQSKYDEYLRHVKEGEEEKLAKEQKEKDRHMYQQTNLLDEVPATPLDITEEEGQIETFDIKQFEPLKYKDKIGIVEDEENFDEEEVDRRIEYLMGKMNDPFKKEKAKDPLDEEF